MPYYLHIGVSEERVRNSCPVELQPYIEAHKLKITEQNMFMHLQGLYYRDGLLSTVGNMFKKKGSNEFTYPKEPYNIFGNEADNDNPESNEQIAVFEMMQRIKILKETGLPDSPK